MFALSLSTVPQPRLRTTVRGGGGVELAVQEWGNPDGPPIVFAHAYGMSHLGWLPQVTSPLADSFRLVTFDHRGHGESEKPLTADAYTQAAHFADDFAAVIERHGLERPVVVAWSMSGALLGSYLERTGGARIAGIVLTAAAHKLGPQLFQQQAGAAFGRPEAQGIFADALAAQIAGWNFVNRHLASEPLAGDAHDLVLATSMLFPLVGRRTILSPDANFLPVYRDLAVPVLQAHDKNDQIVSVAAAMQLVAAKPEAALSLYEGTGHAPHWEGAARFNDELAQFTRRAVVSL